MRARYLVMLMLALLLAACGFHLRGQGSFALPFKTIYVKSPSGNTPFITELKRAIQANGAQLASSPDEAQLTLHIVSELVDKQILSLSGGGRVREYRLLYRVSLRAYDQKQQDWIASEEIALQRDFYYEDVQVLAKEHEEMLLYQNMRTDVVQQVMRRLNRAKPLQQPES